MDWIRYYNNRHRRDHQKIEAVPHPSAPAAPLSAAQQRKASEMARARGWETFYGGKDRPVSAAAPATSAVPVYPLTQDDVFVQIQRDYADAPQQLIERWHKAESPNYENYKALSGQAHLLTLQGFSSSFRRWAKQNGTNLPEPRWMELERTRYR